MRSEGLAIEHRAGFDAAPNQQIARSGAGHTQGFLFVGGSRVENLNRHLTFDVLSDLRGQSLGHIQPRLSIAAILKGSHQHHKSVIRVDSDLDVEQPASRCEDQ